MLLAAAAIASLLTLGTVQPPSVYTAWQFTDPVRFSAEVQGCLTRLPDAPLYQCDGHVTGYFRLSPKASEEQARLQQLRKLFVDCIQGHGYRIKQQFVNIRGQSLDKGADLFSRCGRYKSLHEGRRCLATEGWYLLTAAPWVRETDNPEQIAGKLAR